MNEQVRKFITPLTSFWKKQSKKVKTIILSAGGGIVVLALVLAVLLNQPKYSILYYGMDADETQEVAEKLKELEVDFIESDGTIKVREEDENSLRVELANEGHPRTGFSYDFFLENVDIMTTDMEKKIIEQYQLTQKLEYQIESISALKSATVTINFKEDNGYVLAPSNDTNTASATVTITMNKKGETLSGKQVKGIKTLVANSVPSLTVDAVAVIDTDTGEELLDNDETKVNMAEFKLAIEMQFEKDMEAKIYNLLGPMFGKDNVNVAVKSTMDIDKKIQEVITYLPSEDNKGVVSEEDTSSVVVPGEDGASGVPGTDSNTNVPTYPGITQDGDTIYVQNKESYKYLVSQIKEQIQRDSGEVKDMTASVALNLANLDEENKTNLTKLVANACGIEAGKVALYIDLFNKTPVDVRPEPNNPKGLWDGPLPWIIVSAVIFFMILMMTIVMLISKRRKKKLKMLLATQEEALAAQASAVSAEPFKLEEIKPVVDTKEQVLRKEIQEFSTENPEIAARLIRTWLKGDESDD